MSTTFFASDQELELVGRIYEHAGCSRPGFITGDALVEIFTTSVDLTPLVLSHIWNIADEDKTGNLSERGLAIALRLIGWAQKGESVEVGLVNMPGPLPRIEGITNTDDITNTSSGSESTAEVEVEVEWPSFTGRSKEFFRKLFQDSGPLNGLLGGDKVRDIFLQTNLSTQDLWEIWNLADTQKRGELDCNDFALAMYLLQGTMSGEFLSVPTSIPAHFHQRIYEEPTQKVDETSPAPPSPISHPPKNLVQPLADPAIISRHEKRPFSAEDTFHYDWDVTPTEKTEADQDFDMLDSEGQNFIDGDVLGKFMLKFRLSPEDLAHIWDLADLKNNNRFTRDGFAVAMHLIRRKLAGFKLPFTLPPSLTPPSMRTIEEPQQPIQDNNTPFKKESPTSAHPPPPPLPPKPDASPSSQLHRTASEHHLTPDRSIPLHQYRDLEREKSFLESKVDDLATRLEACRDFQAENDALKVTNVSLSEKIHDMEQTMSQLLQITEKIPAITRQNTLLTNQVADLEQVRSQLAETLRRLDASTQENRELSTRLWDAREAAEAAITRSAEETGELNSKAERLREENEVLRSRTAVMERSISLSQPPSGSATNMHEMHILMSDVTRENEELKRQLRRVQRSTAQFLLNSVNDDLRRENQRLAVQVQELEQLTNQLQSSSEEAVLQRVLKDVTQENEALKAKVRGMRDDATASRVRDLEREVAGFKEEVRMLQAQLRGATVSGQLEEEEDSSMPPPAYDDGITPDQ